MTTIKHPYTLQPDKAFWRKTVADKHPLDIANWYTKKFAISSLPVATAGSCFAQHIGRRLRSSGFKFIDTEPAPGFLRPESHLDYGYGMYSARFGNIYSSRQLLQLLDRAYGVFTPNESVWEKDGGVVDPFRPSLEPEPFGSVNEMLASRDYHLGCVRQMFEQAKVFVFTLGLTEAWTSSIDGAVFPIAPGTAGGTYDPNQHRLLNLGMAQVRKDMDTFIEKLRKINKGMHLLLTVSPVPLLATASNQQVVVATTYSKSVLRAVAGALAAEHSFVDYFPSFEIISSHVMRGQFYNPDMRTVSEHGVNHVMQQFFSEHKPPAGKSSGSAPDKKPDEDDVQCDEELLRVFGA